MGEKIRLI